jgi:cytochrome c2
MSNKALSISLLGFVFLIAACGTVAPPVWETPEEPAVEDVAEVVEAAADVTHTEATAIPPTETPLPPTVTPVPPTATEVPPTVTPTAAPQDPIALLVSLSDPANGEALFSTFYDQASFACSTCHNVVNEERLVGPGLLNVSERAQTRVEGEAAERYLYNSIVNPNAYVVEEYVESLMPQVYMDILDEQEIYDLIAYLLTLTG